MPQIAVWDKEYRNRSLVTGKEGPQKDVLRFRKFLKKSAVLQSGLRVLDLGCGTGRNANYFAGLGHEVTGMDISGVALSTARQRADEMGVSVEYLKRSMGEPFPFVDQSFDLALDVTSSNSLNEEERTSYLEELFRVLRPGAYIFVKALCKDGDKNAKFLLKNSPGSERDTYIMKEIGLTERVFSEQDFRSIYGERFKILKLEKKTSYTRFKKQSYKRNFWIAYLQKPID